MKRLKESDIVRDSVNNFFGLPLIIVTTNTSNTNQQALHITKVLKGLVHLHTNKKGFI